jgi:dihydrolipoamide dehydrogenase
MAHGIVVIGSGTAAVAAAVEATRGGVGVTLVAEEPIGGRGTHASLVPSKVMLHAIAEKTLRPGEGLAAMVEDLERVALAHARHLESRLSDAGVRVVRGVARFVAPDAIEIAREGKDAQREPFDAAVIATGSVPFFPAGFFGEGAKGPDGTAIFAPRHLRTMRELPRTMLVVGGGATGAEAVHAFSALGVEVTWMLDEYGILPDFDRELAESLGDVLMERGVKIVHGKAALRVVRDATHGVLCALDGGRTYSAERAFVALGRRADTARLGLDAAGVRAGDDGSIAVDARMRAGERVWAAGDAAGKPYVANKAALEGWIAGRGAAGSSDVPERGPVVAAVYTSPEVAKVGLSAQAAARAGRPIDVRTLGFAETVKGLLAGVDVDRHARGVLRLVADAESGEVLGATAIGPHAAEVLGPVATALAGRMSLDRVAAVAPATPTFGELAAVAAR